MSSANREALLYKVEVTEGTNPGSTATYLNFTSNSLNYDNEYVQSATVRSDTNIAGNTPVFLSSSGDIGFELRYGEYDPFLEAVLRGTFSTALAISANTTVSFADSDNSINGTGLFTNAVAGQWIKISGASTAGNNGWAFITTKSSNDKIIVSHKTLTTESAGSAVTIKGAVCKNGTTERSYTFERQFLDITRYLLYTGMNVATFGVNFNTSALASGTISFTGMSGVSAGSSGFSGSHTAASTNQIMNTADHIKAIYVDGALSTADFLSLDLSITTNAEALRKLGSRSAMTVNQYSIGVTGNFTVYKEDGTFDGFKDAPDTAHSLSFVTEDAAGNGYVWHFPEVYFTGNQNNQGINTEIQEAMTFTAVLDPTLLHTASVSRYAA